MMNQFTQTKLRVAVQNAIFKDAIEHEEIVKDSLQTYGFISNLRRNPYKTDENFGYKYALSEEICSFLFSKSVTARFNYMLDNGAPDYYKSKRDRCVKCSGVVYTHNKSGKCGNRLCALCYSRMLYRMAGDLQPYLNKGYELYMAIFKQKIPEGRMSWGAGVLFSEKIANPLISKTREGRVQYIRIPFWQYDFEAKMMVLCMAVIIVHKKDPEVFANLNKAVAGLHMPFNDPLIVTGSATKDVLYEWIPEYFSYPLIAMCCGYGYEIDEFIFSNNWYRYHCQFPNRR